jgi:putative PIN family toxin of toxin-antitoxin system
MLRPSVVLDTNVIVSAHLRADGLERFALDLALDRRIQLFYSEPILAEYEAVLSRAKFLGRVYLSEIENGRKEVCVRTLERIAEALSVSLAEFFQEL